MKKNLFIVSLCLVLGGCLCFSCGSDDDGIVYGQAKRWWGSVLNEDKKPEQLEFDVIAESLDKKRLLVGECKWTTQEDEGRLEAELLRKAHLLPFAKQHTIVPMLFLKNRPKGEALNVLLPADILALMR